MGTEYQKGENPVKAKTVLYWRNVQDRKNQVDTQTPPGFSTERGCLAIATILAILNL